MVNRGGKESFRVEVVYALPTQQVVLVLELEGSATVEEVIQRSKITDRFPEIGKPPVSVGIFGKRTTLSAKVHDGDRIEVYRPLIANPKDARRSRARLKSDGKSPRNRG